MKKISVFPSLLLSVGIVCMISSHVSAQFFSDNFDGDSINSGFWSSALPFAGSQLSVQNGYLTTTSRGTLQTVSEFSSPYTISGSVIFNDPYEHFSITMRSDLQEMLGNPYYGLTGVKAGFSVDGGQASIQVFTSTNVTILAVTNYAFTVGSTYNFSITDWGYTVDLALEGESLLSADTDYASGAKIAFQSREFSNTSSSIDSVQIQSVPEPSTYALLLFSGAASLWALKRRKS